MAGTARCMDIESNPPPQRGRGGWKALGRYAAALACVAVVAFGAGRLGPSRVACFTGGALDIGCAAAKDSWAGELIAKEVATAMADPDVKVRLERVTEDMADPDRGELAAKQVAAAMADPDVRARFERIVEGMAADPDLQEHMRRAVSRLRAETVDADVQERADRPAPPASPSSLHRAGADELQGGSGGAAYRQRFVTMPGALPSVSRGKAAATAGPRMQAGPEGEKSEVDEEEMARRYRQQNTGLGYRKNTQDGFIFAVGLIVLLIPLIAVGVAVGTGYIPLDYVR